MNALTPATIDEAIPVRAEMPSEMLVFRSAGQDFCLNILGVREIRGWTAPSPLPHAPRHVEGLINLRGAIIPIIDLAGRLGLPATPDNPRNVIIVTALGRRITGLRVEAVTDIIQIRAEDIQPFTDTVSDPGRALLPGLIVQQDRLLHVLGLEELVAGVAAHP